MTPYAQRRARGLCTGCGSRWPTSARCPTCAERLALTRRGLGGPAPTSLADIARNIGVTRERVRQIYEVAMARMIARTGMTRADVLLGLAALGCASDERDNTPMPRFVRWAR